MVFIITFVVRKWIVTVIMIDRSLYRLPSQLVEHDPDIDDERHNAVAIYTSQLFTWHGYAMLFFGSFYVFFVGAPMYLPSSPIITGVAIAFACLGLVPFFALLALMLVALITLYVLYLTFVCVAWPLEKFGLSRRRAISRRNGGYQSSGTTNTTDLHQLERNLEEGQTGWDALDAPNVLRISPAMAGIPLVLYKKKTDTSPAEIVEIAPTTTASELDPLSKQVLTSQPPSNATMVTESGSGTVDENQRQDTVISIPDSSGSPTTIDMEKAVLEASVSEARGDMSNMTMGTTTDPRGASSSSNAKPDSTEKAPGESGVTTEDLKAFLNSSLYQRDEECAICLCDFEDGDELRHLYCDHLFHRNCVDRWLTKNPVCPKCKKAI
ncbi:hypothetical protein BGW38_000446 [Lunasporangiospora selenospora]|uniref:RING-type E3 ubiquitin transferase n=1 Tax=Lunasporangiospora selenospora TaxID=979761 RepID=A0A9P6KI77_9FUNG|nr:hypothetical protein BGW38_000446 [Lunasporangiospora selenospora]